MFLTIQYCTQIKKLSYDPYTTPIGYFLLEHLDKKKSFVQFDSRINRRDSYLRISIHSVDGVERIVS